MIQRRCCCCYCRGLLPPCLFLLLVSPILAHVLVCLLLLPPSVSAASSQRILAGSSWKQAALRPQVHGSRSQRHRSRSTHDQQQKTGRMSMSNVTCHFCTQPLNHFSAPAGSRRFKGGETFQQRYCIYDGYSNNGLSREDDSATSSGPIFFYTGNESPVDQYVNQTGLMWELAPKHSALIIFAEHRYQGESVPDLTIWNGNERRQFDGCFTHLTSSQALADYAALISYLEPTHERPVIVFGGSYGGMLAAWMRMLYPSSVSGAIAASAPIWGLPLTQENRDGKRVDQSAGISGAAEVIGRAVKLPYPPNKTAAERRNKEDDDDDMNQEESRCFDNLLATWPLISYFGQTELGRDFLTESFRLCNPVKDDQDVTSLLEWAQSPFFDMSEGDFPYRSSHIPFSLNMGNVDLPAWPLQFACHSSGLDKNLAVDITRGEKDVYYSIRYGSDDDAIILDVDWDKISVQQDGTGAYNAAALTLLNATMTAVSVWFNVSKTVRCFDAIPAINAKDPQIAIQTVRRADIIDSPPKTPAEMCQEKLDAETVWTSLVCNEEMNQIITAARGMGNDFYWPPSYPRGTKSFRDTLAIDPDPLGDICADPTGAFGYPSRNGYDSWATWLDDYYGGTRIASRSNIVFSNGLLDPWSSAGVYKAGQYPPNSLKGGAVEKQNVTADGSVVAVLIDLGAHHLDLMFADESDPPCAYISRNIEDEYIGRWIKEWTEERGGSCA